MLSILHASPSGRILSRVATRASDVRAIAPCRISLTPAAIQENPLQVGIDPQENLQN
jgi:hypothetical protein